MATAIAQLETKERRARPQVLAASIIGGCALMLALAEVGVGALSKISRIERRTTSEIAAAIGIGAGGGVPKVLVVGNSLLLEGVDFPALQRALGPWAEAHRLVVEQTFFLDWYYGIRRIFAAGSRPTVVVLKLNAAQLLASDIRGDYSANRLIAAGDLIALARDADLSLTQATSLWFARYSNFYGRRAELRKWLLWTVFPGMQELKPHLAQVRKQRLTRERILLALPPRLEAMRRLAANYGARVVLLVPAAPTEDEETAALLDAGRQSGVEVLAPVAPGTIPPNGFSDGFHLNATGAQTYTAALARELKRLVLGL